MQMITVSGLKKNFGNVEALKGIDFDVSQGELFGLLGPNGAGKTTTISILSTLLRPDAGEVSINGHHLGVHNQEFKQMIGVVPQEIALYEELSAYENLMFWGSLYKIPAQKLKQEVNKALEMLGLSDRAHQKISTYSGGMKRRINIASAMLHGPKVLFMDEPTVGIDPQSRNLIFEVISKLHQQGLTVVYTTHYMEEAERLCNRTAIIDAGQIIAIGTLDELRSISKLRETITLTLTTSDIDTNQFNLPGVDFTVEGPLLHCHAHQVQAVLPPLIMRCSELDLEIANVNLQKVNLETIFLKLTGKKLRD